MQNKKIALVTGASRGIGKDIALKLAESNMNLILTYRDEKDKAYAVAKQTEALGAKVQIIQLDMSHVKSITPFVDTLKKCLAENFAQDKLDFLINNAGMGATVPMEQVTEDMFDTFMNVHFKGVYFLTQAVLSMMNSGGRVINISSRTTRSCNPGYSVYASMKGAIEVLTKYIANEYGAKGIACNVVAPGPVETDFNNAIIRNNPEYKKMLSDLSPLGRVGNPDDISGVVAFLCSDGGKWINGQRIEVSGGINV